MTAAAGRKLAAVPAPREGSTAVPDGMRPVPGSLPWSYAPGAAILRDNGGAVVLGWCPTVTRHMAAWNGRGEIVARRFTIELGDASVTVGHDQVADGSVWSRLPGAIGAGGRDERTALLAIVEDQAAGLPLIPLHPRWDGDTLLIPPADALPRGYTDTAGTFGDWCALIQAVVEAPRIALVMGLAVGGLYVRPLRRQSYVVHLGGGSSVGKTTTATCAAAIFGRPDDGGVIEPWSGTVNGVTAGLRGLHCLTAFRDELGAAGYRGEQLSALMFRVTQGAERSVSTRTGEYRESQGSWHGCLVSTGNHSIVGGIANEGIAARVIEPPMPLTSSADQADMLAQLAEASYGWGLQAIADAKITPATFAQLARECGDEMPLPAGGPARRIGEHLAMGVAGACVLAQIAGVPDLIEVAQEAARETLADLVARLDDHGVKPGDRLLAAVQAAVASNPSAFPTRAAYAKAIEFGAAREIWGWDLTSDDAPGQVAIIDRMIRKITDPQGIEDPGIALRELAGSGDLVRPARGRHLTRLIKANGKPFRAYHLRNVFTESDGSDEADSAGNHTEPGSVTTCVTTPETTSDQGGNHSNHISGNPMYDTYARDGHSAQRITLAGEALPCAWCGEPTRVRVAGEAQHPGACQPAQIAAEPLDPPGGDTGMGEPVTVAQAAPERVSRLSVQSGTDEELSHFRAAIAERYPAGLDDDAVRAALDLWHQVTDGLVYVAYPGQVGVAAYSRLVARHGAMPDPERCASDLVRSISTDGSLWRSIGWLDQAAPIDLDQGVTVHDVRAQFLAAAGTVELGDGEPQVYENPRSFGGLLKLPGYLRVSEAVRCSLPAFADVPAGSDLPMPVAEYLTQRGVHLVVDRAVVWHEHGRRLGAWAKVFRTALAQLAGMPGLAARYAETAVKETYAAFLGGMLRSERYNTTGTMRRDWSDMMIAVADMNALRNLDRASHGFAYGTPDRKVYEAIRAGQKPVSRALGMCRDAVWHVTATAPAEVPGLVPVDEHGQALILPGKFRYQKWCTVTPEIVAGVEANSPYMVRDAVNDAIREREGESA